jgi:pimeloyl-ACP methyl ester carboxylesterase
MMTTILFPFFRLLLAFLLTSCVSSGAVFKPETLSPDLRWVRVENVPVVYTDQGQGDPLLILSPYPLGTELWRDLAGRLSSSARVIVVEPPGLREPDAMRGDFSSDHLLHIYRKFVETVGIGTAHVLGAGETGGLAVAFGHHFPLRTATAVSLNGFEAVTWYEEFQEVLDRFNVQTEEELNGLLSAGSNRYRRQPPSPEEAARLMEPLSSPSAKKAVQDRIMALGGDIKIGYITTMLPAVELPILLIRSENDDVFPEALAAKHRRTIRRAKREVIPQAGHFAFLDRPDEVAARIRNFIAAHPISKAAPPGRP